MFTMMDLPPVHKFCKLQKTARKSVSIKQRSVLKHTQEFFASNCSHVNKAHILSLIHSEEVPALLDCYEPLDSTKVGNFLTSPASQLLKNDSAPSS